jgi:DNA-binding CsgD family transcriptional regulator
MWVAVFCGQRKDCFDTDDIEIARYLAAHIGRAASLSARLAAKRGESLPGASGPIIVVEDAKFVGANAAAHGALFGSGAARAENGRVLFSGEAISRRFGEFLARDGARRTRGALCALDLGDGRYMSVYRPPASEKPASSRAEYLLLFDRESPGVGRAERCAAALSISRSDAELALLFAEGLSPDDVAQLCGGAPSAYRARMSAVYERLGVKDQGALVLRVLAATRSVGMLQAD